MTGALSLLYPLVTFDIQLLKPLSIAGLFGLNWKLLTTAPLNRGSPTTSSPSSLISVFCSEIIQWLSSFVKRFAPRYSSTLLFPPESLILIGAASGLPEGLL